MKILFFVHRIHPSVGGVEKYVLELSRALRFAGHSVTVVASDHTGTLPSHEEHEGITILRFPATRSPLRCRWHLLRMWRRFRSADVISISNTHMLEYYWRTFGPLVEPQKLFLIRHGMSCVYPVPEDEKYRARRSTALVRGVMHDGHFIGKWLDVRPDLCPDQGLTPESDQLDFVPEPPPTSAVYVGRLEPDTGISIYIDAVRILTKRLGRRFELQVYGDGSLMPSLRRIVNRDALPVVFHGRMPNAQEKIVGSCFAFVDGRMVIQEAMARRRLVLAAYVDPLKYDYVSMESFSPFLCPVAHGEELAERAVHFIDQPDARAKAVERAYQFTRRLNWARTAESFVAFWRERLSVSVESPSRWQRSRTAVLLSRNGGRRMYQGTESSEKQPPHPASAGRKCDSAASPIQPDGIAAFADS